MKAIAKTKPAFGAEIIETPVNKPGPGELLVKVSACGICGSDLHIYEWELGADRMVAATSDGLRVTNLPARWWIWARA